MLSFKITETYTIKRKVILFNSILIQLLKELLK